MHAHTHTHIWNSVCISDKKYSGWNTILLWKTVNEYNILFDIFWRQSWSENKMSSRIKEEIGEDLESLKEPSKITEQSDKGFWGQVGLLISSLYDLDILSLISSSIYSNTYVWGD